MNCPIPESFSGLTVPSEDLEQSGEEDEGKEEEGEEEEEYLDPSKHSFSHALRGKWHPIYLHPHCGVVNFNFCSCRMPEQAVQI